MFSNYIKGRRLGIREIFRMTKYAFTKDFANYFKVLAFIFFPINLLTAVINTFISDIQSGFDFSVILESPEKLTAFMESAEYALMNRYNFVMMIVELFFVPLAAMAAARIAYNYAYGKETVFKDVVIETISKGSTLIFATILYIALVMLGICLLIIPGIALVGFFAFYIYAIMVKDAGPISSLKMSFKAVGKNWFRLLPYFIFFYLLDTIITYAVVMILGFLAVEPISVAIVMTIASFGKILYYIAMTILFLNLVEGGFDIKANDIVEI